MVKAKNARPCVIAGNWKMYKTVEESERFVDHFLPLVKGSQAKIFIAPPFTAIQSVAAKCKDSTIKVGAQNMNDVNEGSFTGEVAALMLKDVGAQFVILGHSERRRIFGEDSTLINRKVKRALSDGLQPIVCIGETLEERESEKMQQVLKEQLEGSLANITAEQLKSVIIAYEPVWAIGTGITATPEQAQEAHVFVRSLVKALWDENTAEQTVILYGGSVKPDNTRTLMAQPDIDGVLVGGASLSPDSFAQIVNFEHATVTG